MAEAPKQRRFRLPDGSRSVQSVWVWRGLLFMSLVAVGIAIGLFDSHNGTFGILWLVIGAGWFGMSMWLWRQHVKWDSDEYAKQQGTPAVKVANRGRAKPTGKSSKRR